MATAVTPPALREARRAAGLTQRDLAQGSRAARAHYVRLLERGMTPDPSPEPRLTATSLEALTILGYPPAESARSGWIHSAYLKAARHTQSRTPHAPPGGVRDVAEGWR